MKTDRFRSFGFMLAVIIGGGVVGWILFPLFTAFGVGLAAAIDRKPEKTELEPVCVPRTGRYRVIAVNKAGEGEPSNVVMVVL